MKNAILRRSAWSLALGAACAFSVACSDDADDTETETLTASECTDRGGEAVEQASCPGGRDQLGKLARDEGSAACCETVPSLTPEQCEAQGGESVGDPGDGSTRRNGCPAGEKMLGTLDFGIEGGICCK